METVSRKNGFNIFVGGNATTTNIRSVKANAVNAFPSLMERGDLHASSCVFESFSFIHGPVDFFRS